MSKLRTRSWTSRRRPKPKWVRWTTWDTCQQEEPWRWVRQALAHRG